jgi:glycosyltransferase involved in cell wall biosynthesis
VETFSNAALEAMAMGLPVILSRIGGAAEMVEAGLNGFLYAPGDVTQLTGHIAALAGDEGLARRMGRAAMTRVQGCFGFSRMLDEYRNLLCPAGSDCARDVEQERARGNRKLLRQRAQSILR